MSIIIIRNIEELCVKICRFMNIVNKKTMVFGNQYIGKIYGLLGSHFV